MQRPKKSNPRIVGRENPDYIKRAADVIRSGGVAAIPTETYYGLAVDPFNDQALERLFKIKKRSPDKPVLVLIDDQKQLDELVSEVPDQFLPLINKFWPGPLTLVFPVKKQLSRHVTGNMGDIGVRLTSNPIAREICRMAGFPITATSANISGEAPATTAFEVMKSLGDAVDIIVDGGDSDETRCSTVVGIKDGELSILRAGAVNVMI